MTEIKTIVDKVLFSFDESKITLAKVIGWYKNLSYANLAFANLSGANLQNADLSGANLKGADLRGADLRGANLIYANISGAILQGANLEGAYLKGTYLIEASLQGANLKDAKLVGADLRYAKLEDANFYNADLKGANLICTNLEGANFYNANLKGVCLRGAINVPDIPLACPSEGSFIAWKKVKYRYLVKLEIPGDARRSSATTNKCRCEKALVLDIEDLTTGEHPKRVVNDNYCKCVYEVGKMVYPDSFDDDRWCECSHGIHFFMEKQDAISYLN